MKLLAFEFTTTADYSVPVTDHQLTLRCTPMEDAVQTVQQLELLLEPCGSAAPRAFRDGFGSTVRWVSLRHPHSMLRYGCRGRVLVDLSRAAAEPAPAPALRHPGTLTVPGPALRAAFAALPPALDPAAFCRILCGWLHRTLTYAPGATAVHTTAEAALAGGAGVCQDSAQIFAALARLYGLPARYCMGLTVGEGATHAWAEVWYRGGWHGFDPTRGCETGESYLRFAAGRDAADCPVEQGVFNGLADQTQTVFMRVTEL